MEYRLDGKTGNKLSALGFGCMRFPKVRGSIDMVKTEELVLKAIEGGVNYFDTAYIYPGSEEALGKIIEKNELRDKMYIATKLPVVLLRNSGFDTFFNKQLERLKTDYVDYYLIHMLTDLKLWEKLVRWGIEDWIKEKKQSGRIKQIGFSFHGARDEFMKLLDAYDWDFCQIQYNYLNESYQAGTEGLIMANEKGLPVIVMEPLLGGKLAGGLPKAARRAFETAGDISPAAWAFKWLWNRPEPTVVLSGMNTTEALAENIETACGISPGMLSEKELSVINGVKDIINSSYKIKCTGCGYCMPCEKNVNIPGCFHSYNASFADGRAEGFKEYVMNTGGTAGASGAASQCVKCRKCEKHCPQGIKISEELELVKKRVEPFWFGAVIKAVRAFAR